LFTFMKTEKRVLKCTQRKRFAVEAHQGPDRLRTDATLLQK
jgi:hypothetical protein